MLSFGLDCAFVGIVVAAKNPKTLGVIESLLDQKMEAAAGEGLDENSRAAIDELVRVAERFDAA